jgi:MSHA pilin protein MshD
MRVEPGFSLLETLVAIVVISVALAGVIRVFSSSVAASNDPVVRKQMIALAEELLEEISLKPYASTPNTLPAGCARDTFNDVSDYHNYPTSGAVCDIEGNTISALSGYRLAITVATTAVGGISEFKLVTVTVSRGTDAVVLHGWRSNFAGP